MECFFFSCFSFFGKIVVNSFNHRVNVCYTNSTRSRTINLIRDICNFPERNRRTDIQVSCVFYLGDNSVFVQIFVISEGIPENEKYAIFLSGNYELIDWFTRNTESKESEVIERIAELLGKQIKLYTFKSLHTFCSYGLKMRSLKNREALGSTMGL